MELNSTCFKIKEAVPESRTGTPYNFSTLNEAAGLPLWPLAKPALRTEWVARLWEVNRCKRWGTFPWGLRITPTCSVTSTRSILHFEKKTSPQNLAPDLREPIGSCGLTSWQVPLCRALCLPYMPLAICHAKNELYKAAARDVIFAFRSGHLLGLPCLDHLHYLLSVANVFLARGEDDTNVKYWLGVFLIIGCPCKLPPWPPSQLL